MTDPYEPPRPRDDALLEELNALREQEREGHSTPKEQRRAEQLERRLRVDEHRDIAEQDVDQPAEEFHRDRRQHGGMAEHLDDDRLARLTEEERVEAGIDAYDPDEVPLATDVPPQWDVTQTEEYQEERAEIRREFDKDELQIEGQRDSLPPTHYDN